MLYDLAPEWWRTCPPDHTARMQIAADIRNGVAFFGTGHRPSYGGTGFIQECRGYTWLVTAAHIADDLDGNPFWLWGRFSKPKHCDGVGWTRHPDRSVDVAVTPFHWKGAGVGHLPEAVLLPPFAEEMDYFELGNFVYVVGLFRPLAERRRFLPVVHTGHIALLPGDERLPVRMANGATIEAEGYLIQVPSLSGLSGAPVFVRKSIAGAPRAGGDYNPVGCGPVHLLGIFIAAFDGKPERLYELGRAVDVPVGMGIVVPSHKIVEAVDEYMRKHRKEMDAERPAANAKTGFARSEPPTMADNPRHKEDFNRLLDEAVRRPKRDDQT